MLENKLFMDTLLLFLPLEKQNLSSNSHLNLYTLHNVNEYIQQYNVPGLKADTIHATMPQSNNSGQSSTINDE